jgi:trans-aconitate methyltransferase
MTPEQAGLAGRYLTSRDPLEQSGFSGGRERWERLRRPVAEAVPTSGSFLDVGCANGALLEDVVAWCGDRGVDVDPWGLDVSPELVHLAQRRLPDWSDRFFAGDAGHWSPPRRWDVVRTELVYVDRSAQQSFVHRLLTHFVSPAGACWCAATGIGRRRRSRWTSNSGTK